MVQERQENNLVEGDTMIIPPEELLKETDRFINWSGSYLIKILSDGDGEVLSHGSGGLIKYRDRYFAVTCKHVVRSVEKSKRKSEINIPYKDKNQNDRRATIIAEGEDIIGSDLAAFEVSPNSVAAMYNHSFLDESFLEKDTKGYMDRSNIVFTHGYPFFDTLIDHENKVIDMTTLPFTTFIESYDDTADALMIHADLEGITKFRTKFEIQTFFGMSGSLIYGYYLGEPIPYKCLGILTDWELTSNRLWVSPTQDILNFLDREFFKES